MRRALTIFVLSSAFSFALGCATQDGALVCAPGHTKVDGTCVIEDMVDDLAVEACAACTADEICVTDDTNGASCALRCDHTDAAPCADGLICSFVGACVAHGEQVRGASCSESERCVQPFACALTEDSPRCGLLCDIDDPVQCGRDERCIRQAGGFGVCTE